MAENSAPKKFPWLVFAVVAVVIVVVPATIYYFRVYGQKSFDSSPLWGADGPERAAAAQKLALTDDPDAYAAGLFALSESKIPEVFGPIKILFDKLTAKRSEADYFGFYETAASKIPSNYFPRLESAFGDASDSGLRERALLAIACAKRPNAEKLLVESLQDPAPGVRNRAVRLLGRYGGPDVTASILKMLEDRDESIAKVAKEVILSTRPKAALEGLADELLSPEFVARERADNRLKFLLDSDAGFDPSGSEDSRMQSAAKWNAEIRKYLETKGNKQ